MTFIRIRKNRLRLMYGLTYAEAEAEGDPLKLHYVSAVSDQLTGEYTIEAADLTFGASAETKEASGAETEAEEAVGAETEADEEAAAAAADAEPLVITSDDGGTTMTFNPDGTYVFAFEAHGIKDPGTWAYEDGKLIVTNANDAEAEAEGDPLKLHYVSSVSDQLVGDFTIPADDFS